MALSLFEFIKSSECLHDPCSKMQYAPIVRPGRRWHSWEGMWSGLVRRLLRTVGVDIRPLARRGGGGRRLQRRYAEWEEQQRRSRPEPALEDEGPEDEAEGP